MEVGTQTESAHYVVVHRDESLADATEVPLIGDALPLTALRIEFDNALGIKYRSVYILLSLMHAIQSFCVKEIRRPARFGCLLQTAALFIRPIVAGYLISSLSSALT